MPRTIGDDLNAPLSPERVLDRVLALAADRAGARRAFLIVAGGDRLSIQAQRTPDGEAPARVPAPVDGCEVLSSRVVERVARTGERVVLDDAAAEGPFRDDPYVQRRRPRSLLCAPLALAGDEGEPVAIVYLEDDRVAAFTPEQQEALRLIAAPAALAVQGALLAARALGELRTMQGYLLAQEKLASLGALTAGIAHEIKNPLNFVTNFAELSAGLVGEIEEELAPLRRAEESEAVAFGGPAEPPLGAAFEALDTLRENVRKINEHGRRAGHIIEGMLMHARTTAGPREPVDLNALVAESVNLAYHGARAKTPGENLSIDARYDPAVGAVEVVSSEISRVLINVIDNACYAMQQRRRDAAPGYAPTLTVRTRDLGERVEVSIRDNGTGIPAAVREKVMSPFFTTKPPGDGTGLGLSISHDIVAAHQGTLRIESVEGEGTEIVIELPRRQRAGAGSVTPPAAPRSGP